MLDLTTLELILGPDSIRTFLSELRALPGSIIFGCKTAGGRVL
jgi:hypothetical protein